MRILLLERRRSLDEDYRCLASRCIAKRLMQLPAFKRSQRIATFTCVNAEVDISPVYHHQIYTKKYVYLPSISKCLAGNMQYMPYDTNIPLQYNRFKILEPKNARPVPLFMLDVICVPLVAFDDKCNRLGMGGGYYDRLMQKLRSTKAKVCTLGIAFDAQKIALVPKEAHDLPLDYVLTERKLYTS